MESSAQTGGNATPVSSRRRSRNGCAQCRTRKVKCDERPGGCITCHRLGFHCSFLTTEVVLDSPSSVDGELPAKKRVRRACLLCRSQKLRCSGELPKCERCLSKRLSCNYQTEAASISASGSRHNRANSRRVREEHIRAPEAAGSLDQTVEPADSLIGNAERSSIHLSQSVDASKGIIQQHIDAFFQYVYPTSTFNFIHRGSFLRSWHKGLMSPSLLRASVGIARRYMGLDQEPAARWLEESERDVLTDLNLISIPKLQILLFLIFDRSASANFSAVWYLLSLAARIAHGLKLGQPTDAVPFTNQECRRRLVWCIYSNERMAGMETCPDTTYPPLCPRSFVQVQLPCDERSFELEFECKTHSLDDLAQNRYDNAPRLGATAYLIRILDLREQIQAFSHRHGKQPGHWAGDDEFWRLEQELSEFSSSLPAEMQDSERAVYIRSSTPESSVYIMVQTWLRTCWAELTGPVVYESPDAGDSPVIQSQADFADSCRSVLLEHTMSLHHFWSRIWATQQLSRKLFVTDWNIAPCVYGNTRDVVHIYSAQPSLSAESRATIEAALRLNLDILGTQKGLSEYSLRWYRKLVRLMVESEFSFVINEGEERGSEGVEVDRSRVSDPPLSIEDELVARRKHEDARFPRRSGFRASQHTATGERPRPQARSSTSDLRRHRQAPTSPMQSHGVQSTRLGSDQGPTPDSLRQRALSGTMNFPVTVDWDLDTDSVSALYAQGLYDNDGSSRFGFSPDVVMDGLLGSSLSQDQMFSFLEPV